MGLAGAESGYQKALELNPNAVGLPYAMLLIAMRRPEEAREQIEKALELDPLKASLQGFLALHFFYERRYDEAIAQAERTLSTNPHFVFAHAALWSSFHEKQMYEESLAAAKEYFSALGRRDIQDALDRCYAEGGYRGAMGLAADTLASGPRVRAGDAATLYVIVGQKARALEYLEKAYEERTTDMVFLDTLPTWESLRDEPRFQDLLRRTRLNGRHTGASSIYHLGGDPATRTG